MDTPPSTRRELAESLYGMIRHEYLYRQRRYKPKWENLPRATQEIYITVVGRFLTKHKLHLDGLHLDGLHLDT